MGTRVHVSRLGTVCLAFIGIDQVNDPLLDATLWQYTFYWLARVGALAFGLFAAAVLLDQPPLKSDGKLPWLRPVFLTTTLGILPLVAVELLLEPHLPLRPEFVDEEARAVSLLLAFVSEYFTVATLLLPIHLIAWAVLPKHVSDSKPLNDRSGGGSKDLPEFLVRVGLASTDSVLALKAEEHYVRVIHEGGDPLVSQQFREAISQMPSSAGLQVHRSWWVADSAVVSAERGTRRWQLRLQNDLQIPISDSYLREVRERGLLAR
ncbi:MAG: LytTR family DNA-binding domain-containing protein [Pseudomonadota bacterium]